MIELYPHQQAVVEAVRASFRAGKRAPVLVSPTGSGKTVMFSYLARSAASKGNTVAIAVHRKELVEQISKTLRAFGVAHGMIAADYIEDPRHLVQVASVQTWVRRLGRLSAPKLIIADEAHHVTPDSTWGRIREAYGDARWLGVTATPERLDGTGLDKSFDDMILGPSVRELIDLGFLSDYTLYAPGNIDLSGVHRRMGEYRQDELAAVMDKRTITGDAVAHYVKHARGLRFIARGVSVQHSQHIAEQFRAAGITCLHVDGETPREERMAAVDAFRAGEVQGLSNVELFSEGFDVPEAKCAIDLRPTDSETFLRQFWGRVLRKGDRAVILDPAGNAKRHGMLPDDEREWSLAGRSKTEKKRDPDDVAIRQCKACGSMNRANALVCRDCGAAFVVKPRAVDQVDGELVAVDPAVARIEFARSRAAAKDLESLAAIGRARGMRNPEGWAAHVLAARQAKASR